MSKGILREVSAAGRSLFVQTARMSADAFILEITGQRNPQLVESVTRFIVEEYECMQIQYRIALVLLTLSFRFSALVRSGKPYERTAAEFRGSMIRNWLASRCALKKNYMTLLLNLMLLSLFDQGPVLEKYGVVVDDYHGMSRYYGCGDQNG